MELLDYRECAFSCAGFKIYIYLFIYLATLGILVVACGIFGVACWMNSYLQHVGSSSQPGIELRSPALGVWILSHWTSREVTEYVYLTAMDEMFVSLQNSCGETYFPK